MSNKGRCPRASLILFFTLVTTFWSVVALAKIRADSELSVYRFFSHFDLKSANVGSYALENGLFVPKQVGVLALRPAGANMCGSLLSHLQDFSLNIMQRVSYLAPDEFTAQAQLIKDLSPEQVTFLEMTYPVLRAEVLANPDKYPKDVVSFRPAVLPENLQVRQAGLWIIAGQSFYPHGGEYHGVQHPRSEFGQIPWRTWVPEASPGHDDGDPHLILVDLSYLPWQIDPHLYGPGGKMVKSRYGYADLDRQKYPLIWELGRAAQLSPELIDPMLRAAVTTIFEEVTVTLQSEVEDAFIFVKALDEKRYRRFHQLGFRPLDGACETFASCVMVAPLTDLMKIYPPGSLSSRVKAIQSAFKGGPSFADALNILRRTQLYFRAELDLLVPQFNLMQRSPLIMHDFSPNYELLLRIFGEHHGLSTPEAIAAAHHLSSFRREIRLSGTLSERIPVEPFVAEFYHRAIVRITNLDPQMASDANYLPLALIGTYAYIVGRYAELHVVDPESLVERVGTQIAIQTSFPEVAAAAWRLGGEELKTPVSADEDGHPLYTFVFTGDQVRWLKALNPARAHAAQIYITQGFWFFRSITADPLKF